jgi:hypothetical protein
LEDSSPPLLLPKEFHQPSNKLAMVDDGSDYLTHIILIGIFFMDCWSNCWQK